MKLFISLFLVLFTFSAQAESVRAESVDFSCEGDNGSIVYDNTEYAALLSCRFDSDCRFTQKCEFGRCVDKDSCTSDYQCSYGNICEMGRCRQAECRGGPYDCLAGERCTNGRCERDPFAKRCTTSNDCKTYERCSMGYCQ